MNRDLKREIERLLDDPAAGETANLLRARLAATLSEGLSAPDASAEANEMDTASMAAFIDGRLTDAERDTVAATLARHPGLRHDLESAAALVSSVADAPVEVPGHLMARAGAQFAPAAPRPTERPRWQLSWLLPRRRMALVAAVALAVIVIAPASLMISSWLQPHVNGEPDLTSAPDDDDDSQAQSCEDKTKAKPAAEQPKSDSAAPAAEQTKSDAAELKDAASSASAPNSSATAPKNDPCATPPGDVGNSEK